MCGSNPDPWSEMANARAHEHRAIKMTLKMMSEQKIQKYNEQAIERAMLIFSSKARALLEQ